MQQAPQQPDFAEKMKIAEEIMRRYSNTLRILSK